MNSRVQELDGIRGIAILMVLAYHIFPQAEILSNLSFTRILAGVSEMGWAGVDLFFVLSGFLITTILLDYKGKEHYFRNFYARRILRIFPVYYFCISLLFVGYYFTGAGSMKDILKTGAWFYLYLCNWLFAANLGPGLYFSHLWSLAIEEQFYLVWPLIVFYCTRKSLFRLGGALMLVAFAARIYLVFFHGDLNIVNTFPYYSTMTRIDSLIMGALIAAAFQAPRDKQQLSKDAPATLILAAVLIGICIALKPSSPVWNNAAMLTIGFTALALFASSLIIILLTRDETHFARRFFRHPVLIFFGKYSYALYVFHWPVTSLAIDIYAKSGNVVGWWTWLAFVSFCFSATIIAALISWNLLEKHALKLKRYFE